MKSADIIFRSLNLSRAKRDANFDISDAPKNTGTSGGASVPPALSSTNNDGEMSTPAGADDFLPLFIWVVLHSHIPNLASNCEYISRFLNPFHQMGKAGYYLVNLQSAIQFVNYVEAGSLVIDPEEFSRLIANAEAELDKAAV